MKSPTSTRRNLLTLAGAALLTPAVALAQRGRGADPYGDEDDERGGRRGPVLGVARVSVADGDVRIVNPAGDEEQARAGMPLMADFVLLTKEDSRSEVQLDRGNFLRLAPSTEIRFLQLGNRSFRVELMRGFAELSQFKGGEADLELQTGLGSVVAIKPGAFSIEYRSPIQMDVTVRDGQVDVLTDEGTRRLKNGVLSVRGEPDSPTLRAGKADPKTDFEVWAKRRDKMLDEGRGRGAPWFPVFWGGSWGRGWGGYPGFWGPGFYGPRRARTVFVGVGVGGRSGGRGRGRRR